MIEAVVLGVAQDGGHPQPGCLAPCCSAPWDTPGHRIASLGLRSGMHAWLIDATPDIGEQLSMLGGMLEGIFLTHAHIGHYTGLMYLGREAMDVRGLDVFVMPRMAAFLRANAPWEALIRDGNIRLRELGGTVSLPGGLAVRPIVVPHRDEYSETVGFEIVGPTRRIVWVPDVDGWSNFPLSYLLRGADRAFVDGTFYSADELGGRDAAEIPHPLIPDTIAAAPAALRERLRFIHLNHTNPALRPGPERDAVLASGASIAVEGERFPL